MSNGAVTPLPLTTNKLAKDFLTEVRNAFFVCNSILMNYLLQRKDIAMKILNFLIILSLMFLFTTVKAQECVILTSPGFPQIPDESFGDSHILGDYSPTETRTVYIAAHIVRSSSGQGGISINDLNTAISDLNTAYSNVMIQFIHDQTDYIDNDNYTTLTTENFPSLAQINVVANKLNIYFCPQGSGINGIAYLANNKCAVTNAAAINGSTLPHEVGHNFYLYHTHGNGIQEYVNGSNCTTAGDFLCDTPAEPYNGGNGINGYVYTNTCVYFGTFLDPNNQLFTPDTHNFEGYAPANCRDSFTEQQIQKMNQTLSTILSYLITVPVPLANKINDNVIPNEVNKPSTLTVIGGQTVNSGNNASLLDGSSYDIRTNQERFPNYLSYGNIKHNNWNDIHSEFLLTENYTVNRLETPHRDANFLSLNFARININLEGQPIAGKGAGEFQDPWFVLANGSQPGNYWKLFTSFYEPTGKEGATEKGAFLNQGSPNWTPPYYSVKAPAYQDINLGGIIGTSRFYFQNWNGTNVSFQYPNSVETGVVFTSSNAVVNANLKGTELSDEEEAYNNPGQSKFIKTTHQQYGTNYFHKVYESMGNVWYEMSTDGGSTWQIMNNGKPLNTGGGSAKYPSIDYSPDYYYPNQVIIVFLEERLEPVHEYYIMAQFYNNGIFQYESIVASNEENYHVGEFSKPVVARRSPTFLVAWDDSPLLGSRGLMYRLGQLGAQIYWNTDALPVEYGLGDEYRNPSLAISKSGTGLGTYRLAFDKGTNIVGVNLEVFQTGTYPPYSVRENSGYAFGQAGFSQNYQPSISVMPNNDFRISWFGSNGGAKQIVTYWNYQFYIFGTNVSSHSMSVTDDGKAIIAYGDLDGTRNKFRQVWYWGTEKNLGTTGKQTHLSNGSSTNNMYAMSFQNVTLPYSFSMSASLGSLQKVTEIPIACGRKGIVAGDSAEFYFTLGDVTLDGNTIDFIPTGINPDFSKLDTLNYYLSTQKFNVTNSSQFNFSIEYGVTDSLKAVQSLAENEYVKFKLQLINANTNNVIGEYTVVNFTKQNVIPYYGESFSINTNGIGNKKVRVRIVVEENIGGNYAMANIHAEENVLPKQNQNVISYSGSEVVTDYALEQNYPNPFNPTTTIKFQIPTSGNVSIKVYDILGNEVANLVDGYMETGKYEVNYDASSLASGVYIYRLHVNDYMNVKKMVLLK